MTPPSSYVASPLADSLCRFITAVLHARERTGKNTARTAKQERMRRRCCDRKRDTLKHTPISSSLRMPRFCQASRLSEYAHDFPIYTHHELTLRSANTAMVKGVLDDTIT